ncbi:MAG: hypothetical protein EHM93_17635 [Bacteroidales bacterium]|nr:MAG: hypothetical protein EHM93_17635 [Bacteroidales bacterium]
MEYLAAKKLREEWGDKPCDHPAIEKEYYADTHTLDYVCVQCGEEFTVLEMLEAKENFRKSKKGRKVLLSSH